MPSKLKYSFVKKSFEKEGYKLLSKEYINNSTHLYYICLEGHKHKTTWANWNSGYRCPYCAGQGKPSIVGIKSELEKEGYKLLSKKYINNHTKLEYICPNDHKHKISWSEWKDQGNRCPHCSGNAKNLITDIKEAFDREGYILLSNKYVNAHTKLKYICKNGHNHSITLNNWNFGKRCPECAGNLKHNIDFVKLQIEKENYILLSSLYKNAHKKLDIQCPKGHIYKSSWHNWDLGKRCPVCPSQQSKFEKEVRLFLDTKGLNNYLHNHRSLLINPVSRRPMELDIFFPKLNKAIECNGVYWHSKRVVVERDNIKNNLCLEKGISLLVICDDEWYDEKSNIRDKIMRFLEEGSNVG